MQDVQKQYKLRGEGFSRGDRRRVYCQITLAWSTFLWRASLQDSRRGLYWCRGELSVAGELPLHQQHMCSDTYQEWSFRPHGYGDEAVLQKTKQNKLIIAFTETTTQSTQQNQLRDVPGTWVDAMCCFWLIETWSLSILFYFLKTLNFASENRDGQRNL